MVQPIEIKKEEKYLQPKNVVLKKDVSDLFSYIDFCLEEKHKDDSINDEPGPEPENMDNNSNEDEDDFYEVDDEK